MKIYLVAGTHHEVPNSLSTAHITQAGAAASALRMVNMIRADAPRDGCDSDEQTPPLAALPAGADWRAGLREAQRCLFSIKHKIALIGCNLPDDGLADGSGAYVEIVELEMDDVPDLPAALKGLIDAGQEVADVLVSAIDTHIYDDGEEPEDSPERVAIAEFETAAKLAKAAQLAAPVAAQRIAVGVHGGIVQWALADRPGAEVIVLDFDVEDQSHIFDYRLITDDSGDTSAAAVSTESPEVNTDYFVRLDKAPICNTEGDVYGDDDEDQVEDTAKWLVTGEIGIMGPEGRVEGYSGYVPADDGPEAIQRAISLLERRHEETGVKIWSLKALAPTKGGAR